MKKGTGKDRVVVLDRYTMKEVTRFENVLAAVSELDVSLSSIYVAICKKAALYDCYWVYERDLPAFVPRKEHFKRVKGVRIPEKLKNLIG